MTDTELPEALAIGPGFMYHHPDYPEKTVIVVYVADLGRHMTLVVDEFHEGDAVEVAAAVMATKAKESNP